MKQYTKGTDWVHSIEHRKHQTLRNMLQMAVGGHTASLNKKSEITKELQREGFIRRGERNAGFDDRYSYTLTDAGIERAYAAETAWQIGRISPMPNKWDDEPDYAVNDNATVALDAQKSA